MITANPAALDRKRPDLLAMVLQSSVRHATILERFPSYADLLRMGNGWEPTFLREQYRKAVYAVTKRAIRDGVLVRPATCEECGGNGRIGKSKAIESHHPDYDRPLLIQWLCRRCHARADGRRRIRQKRFPA